jgi:glycosyltransferase involved in cell wall biosynthesis
MMDKKNVLFVGPYPPPYGGISSHLYSLLPALIKEQYRVITLTRTTQDNRMETPNSDQINLYTNLKKHAVKRSIIILGKFFLFLNKKLDLDWRRYLYSIVYADSIANLIRQYEISVVFVYTLDDGLVVPLLKDVVKKKCSFNIMVFGDLYLWPQNYIPSSRYLRSVFLSCNRILSSSQYCADSIMTVLGLDFKVEIIYVGVDEFEFYSQPINQQLRGVLHIVDDAIVFLFLGRMDISMGVDFILEVAEKLLEINEKIYLILAGADGFMRKSAENLSKKFERIRFCPNISNEEKSDYYAVCDVLIAPTMDKHACMGVSIKEAMLSGKPVIASSSGGIPEAVEEGITGYVIPFIQGKLDKGFFLDRVKILLNAKKRSEMGASAYERAKKYFTNEATVAAYMAILKDQGR